MTEKKEILDINFPSNSIKKEEDEKDSIKKPDVITTNVVRKKKTLKEKFSQMFLEENLDNVIHYVVHDVLVPAAEATFKDSLEGGLSMLLHGEKRDPRSNRIGGASYITSYGDYFSQGNRSSMPRPKNPGRDFSTRKRTMGNFDDIVIKTRLEAEDVLIRLTGLVEQYDQATVDDLYSAVGITGDYTDRSYGWVNLTRANVVPCRGGYLLNLPKPIYLN